MAQAHDRMAHFELWADGLASVPKAHITLAPRSLGRNNESGPGEGICQGSCRPRNRPLPVSPSSPRIWSRTVETC